MYAAKKAEGAPTPVLKELAEIGKKLRTALELSHLDPHTLGGKAALSHAEEACNRLTALIAYNTPLAPTLEAATIRVRRMPELQSKSEARKTGGNRH
jgi:hypothetical protein